MSSISSEEFEHYKTDFFGDKSLCDITLTGSDGEIQLKVHQRILAAKSNVFSLMFGGSFKEAKSSEGTFENIDGKTLETVINFIYSNEIDIDSDTVEDVLKAADFLKMEPLKLECFEYLLRKLDISNAWEILLLAEQYLPSHLSNCALKFAFVNFQELIHTENFLSMDIDQLRKIISSNTLRTFNESFVFDAIWYWTFNNIKFHDLCTSMLLSTYIARNSNGDRMAKYLENRFEYLCLLHIDKINIENSESDIISSRFLHNSILLQSFFWRKNPLLKIGGWDGSDHLTISSYSPIFMKWSYIKCRGPATSRRLFGSTILDGKLYIAGGHLKNRVTNYVDCLELKKLDLKLTQQPELLRPWFAGKYVILENRITDYVGCLELKSLDFKWTQLPPLLTSRSECAMTTLNGHLYVVGGTDNAGAELNSIEKYDPSTEQWVYIDPMRNAVGNPIVGAMGSSLCVARNGGDGNEIILDIYDPETGEWTYDWSHAKHPLLGMATISINEVDHFYTISRTEIKKYNNLEANNSEVISVNWIDDTADTQFSLFADSFVINNGGIVKMYWPILNEWETLPDLDTSSEWMSRPYTRTTICKARDFEWFGYSVGLDDPSDLFPSSIYS